MKNKYITQGLKETGLPRFWNGFLLVILSGALIQAWFGLALLLFKSAATAAPFISGAGFDLAVVLAFLGAMWLLGLSKAVENLEA